VLVRTNTPPGTLPRMILCIAGNPSIDKLFEVEHLTPGGIHRPGGFTQVPGGKGLNVARAATALGADVIATGILGGHAGRWVAQALDAEGVTGRFAWAVGETKSSLSVADHATGRLTEFYEDGSAIDEGAWEMLERIAGDLLRRATWVTMSGSLPPGAPADGYARLVRTARRLGVAAALDASGGPLDLALTAGPNVVKVNAEEAGGLLGDPIGTVEDAARGAAAIVRRSGGPGRAAVITRGAEGAVLVAPDGSTWVGRLYERGPYPVGSGDAFLAGLIVALDRGDDWPDALAVALAAGTANAQTGGAGRLVRERVPSLVAKARVSLLDDRVTGTASTARRTGSSASPPN
jgi:1-phosphofructokinase family hexose kinase